MEKKFTLLVENGKQDPAYYLVIDGDVESVAKEILKTRIDSKYYYDEDGMVEAQKALDNGNAWRFLQSRADYEYEEVSRERFQNV